MLYCLWHTFRCFVPLALSKGKGTEALVGPRLKPLMRGFLPTLAVEGPSFSSEYTFMPLRASRRISTITMT